MLQPATWALALALILVPAHVRAESRPTIIDAGSRDFRIIDGGDKLVGVLSDSASPDVYVYHPSPGPKKISYVTDRARADFHVAPGAVHDLAIRFQGRLYRQRLVPIDPNQSVYDGAAADDALGVDTIPFRLGSDNLIYMAGSVNGSRQLDLIFDTGASISVVTDEAAAKGAQVLEGNRNRLQIGGITIARTPIRLMAKVRGDGVIGYNAFIGKVVEIDYDDRVLRISSELPSKVDGYRKLAFAWREMASLVPLKIGIGDSSRQVLAVFDTGSKWSLSLNGNDPLARQGLDGLQILGRRTGVKADGGRVKSTVVTLPSVQLAGFELASVQAEVEQAGSSASLPINIVGNDFLKRFNVIIDYRTGEAYFRPNSLAPLPYNRVVDPMLFVIAGAIALLIVGLGAIIWLRRRRGAKRLRVSAESAPG